MNCRAVFLLGVLTNKWKFMLNMLSFIHAHKHQKVLLMPGPIGWFVHLNVCNSTPKSGTGKKCTRNIDIHIPNTHTHEFSFFRAFFFIHSLPISRVGIWDAIQTEFCVVFFAQAETHLIQQNARLCYFLFHFAYLHAKKTDMKKHLAPGAVTHLWMYTVQCTHCAKCDVYFLHETTLNNHWLRRAENSITNRVMFDVRCLIGNSFF